MNGKTIGEYIAELRKSAGLTQRELASKLNVSDKAVSRWERDESLPDLYMAADIADFFGITADELLHCGKNEEKNVVTQSETKADDAKKRRLNDENIERVLRVKYFDFNARSNIVRVIPLLAFAAALAMAHGLDAPGIDGWLLGLMTAFIVDVSAAVYQTALAVKLFNYTERRITPMSKNTGERIAECRERLTKKAMVTVGMTVTVFVLTVVYLHLGDWLEFLLCGLIFAPISVLGCLIISLVVWDVLKKRGRLS